jgi:outer membrane protein assembly factor BamB
MRYALSLVALIFSVAALSADDTWPQYRGPAGNGISNARNVPTTWSETENVRWKVEIHDKGWSSPVVWGNQVWVTTAGENGFEFFAVCVDRKSGSILHDLKLFTESKPVAYQKYNSCASPTPVAEEGRLYAHFGTHGTAGIDTATGKVLWENRELHCDHWRGPASSPIIYGNLLLLTFDGYDSQFVAALDKTNGKIVWKKDRDIKFPNDNGDLKKGFATPSILELNGKPQLVSPAAEATIAYDPLTGNELWRVIHGGMNEAARPVFGHGMIYLTSGHTTNLLAVRQGGTGLLSKDDIVWKTNRAVPSRPSLLLIDDYLYMVSDAGIASCVDAKTGKYLWNERLGKPQSGSPIAVGGRIYAASEEGTTYIFEAAPKFKLVAANKLDAGCMASPAVVDGALFLRTKTHLYCIESK